MSETVSQQVLALNTMELLELKAMWRRLFDTDPPPFSKKYLIPRLAYRIQEMAYGPMNDRDTKKLQTLADQVNAGKGISKVHKPRPGTMLIREYQGVPHEVIVSEQAFIYKGQPFKSLSAIARFITGTQWNGLVFFGVKS